MLHFKLEIKIVDKNKSTEIGFLESIFKVIKTINRTTNLTADNAIKTILKLNLKKSNQRRRFS